MYVKRKYVLPYDINPKKELKNAVGWAAVGDEKDHYRYKRDRQLFEPFQIVIFMKRT
jgi:hypothetical protein